MSTTTEGGSDSCIRRLLAMGTVEQPLHPPANFSRIAPWQLRAGFATEAGRRLTNEDSGYANVREGIFLVADGVGGSYGGAIASQLLIDTIPPLLLPIVEDPDVGNDQLCSGIQESVYIAQKAMAELARDNEQLMDMGSTIVLGLIAGRSLLLTHAGDSRAYLVRKGTIIQLTKDHSMVQSLVDAGCLTKEEAKRHIYRHVITESINPRRGSPVSVSSYELMPGDRLLFTTDGLTDVVEEDVIAWLIKNSANPHVTAEVLVREALDQNARDNITCLVVHVESDRADEHLR